MIENRKFIRLKVPLSIQYAPVKKNRRVSPQPSVVRNISIAGLSLMVKDLMRPGELLNLWIEVPHHEQPIRLVGDVVWCAASSEAVLGISREAGVRFRDANPAELNRLLDYVYSVAISES